MEIRIAVPRVPPGLLANLLGLAGLVGVAAAVGGLAGNWWWSVLVGAFFAVGLSYVAQTQAAAAPPAEQDATVSLRAVETPRVDERARDAAYMRGEPVSA